MSNFFLLNDTIDVDGHEVFKAGMSELVAIERDTADVFMKHESLYNLNALNEFYSNATYGQDEVAIIQFIEQLTRYENYIPDEPTFGQYFPNVANAFLGINFSETTISSPLQIIDSGSYLRFKDVELWDISFRNLWAKRTKLFPHLTLCDGVEDQIQKVGDSSYFNLIIEKLTEFDKAVATWTTGDFSYKIINRKFALIISPESDGTMRKYGNHRIFQMPQGGTEYFELHIKTKTLRFHFYPDNKTRKVYVGYIGPHLPTISN